MRWYKLDITGGVPSVRQQVHVLALTRPIAGWAASGWMERQYRRWLFDQQLHGEALDPVRRARSD